MERITFANISIESADPSIHRVFPILMDIEKRHADSGIGKIRDVSFRDIYIRSGSGILVQGMPESAMENLAIENLTLRVDRADDYSDRRKAVGGRRTTKDERDTLYARQPSYITLAHVDGATLEDIRVLIADDVFKEYERAALSCHEVENARVRNVSRQPAGKGGKLPVVRFHNCRRMLVTGCRAERGTPAFVGLIGKRTADISLVGNDLRDAAEAVTQAQDVPANALRRR